MDPVKENSAYQAAPPRYRIATALALLVPFLCYTSIWCSAKPARALVLCLIVAASILLLVEVKQYFRYLSLVGLLRPVSEMIAADIITGSVVLALICLPVNRYEVPFVFRVLSLVLFLAVSLNVYAGIVLGGKLQDMGSSSDNSFLLALGIAYRYIVPLLFMFTLIAHYSNNIDPVYFSSKYTWLRIVAATLLNIPNMLFAAMFFITGKKIGMR